MNGQELKRIVNAIVELVAKDADDLREVYIALGRELPKQEERRTDAFSKLADKLVVPVYFRPLGCEHETPAECDCDPPLHDMKMKMSCVVCKWKHDNLGHQLQDAVIVQVEGTRKIPLCAMHKDIPNDPTQEILESGQTVSARSDGRPHGSG